MSFPVYIHIGPWTLHPHIVFETLAYFLGFRVYQVLKYRRGDVIDASTRWSVIAAAAAGAAIGSKILYWFEDPWQTLAKWNDPVYMMGGKTIVGGLLGGWIAVEWMKHAIEEKTRTGDLFAAPIAFATSIGRIGCFLTGLTDNTYGIATSLPWGVDFGDGIHRHPTQLYESVFCFALGVALLWYQRKPRSNGDAFKMMMVGYMSLRLLIDFIKPGVTVVGLTCIQWTCVGILVYYAGDIRRLISGKDPASP